MMLLACRAMASTSHHVAAGDFERQYLVQLGLVENLAERKVCYDTPV